MYNIDVKIGCFIKPNTKYFMCVWLFITVTIIMIVETNCYNFLVVQVLNLHHHNFNKLVQMRHLLMPVNAIGSANEYSPKNRECMVPDKNQLTNMVLIIFWNKV